MPKINGQNLFTGMRIIYPTAIAIKLNRTTFTGLSGRKPIPVTAIAVFTAVRFIFSRQQNPRVFLPIAERGAKPEISTETIITKLMITTV